MTGNANLDGILTILGAITTIAATIATFLPKGSKWAVALMRLQALDFKGHLGSSVAGKQ